MILFNGLVGPRNYRLMIVWVDGMLLMYRPYVGWYTMIGDFE